MPPSLRFRVAGTRPSAGSQRCEAGGGQDLRDSPLVTDRHHVHTGHPGQLAQRGHRLRAGGHARGGHPVRRAPRAAAGLSPSGTTTPGIAATNSSARSERIGPTPARIRARPVQPEIAHPGQPGPNVGDVEHELGLHELGRRRRPWRPAGPGRRCRCPPRRAGTAAAGRPRGRTAAGPSSRSVRAARMRPLDVRSNTASRLRGRPARGGPRSSAAGWARRARRPRAGRTAARSGCGRGTSSA